MADKPGAPNDDSEQPQRDSIEIGTGRRTVCGGLGAIGLGTGGAAVFITHLEAGPVAILAVGVLFAIMAIGGRLPWRIKIGNTEIELAQVLRENKALRDVLPDLAAAAPEPKAEAAIRQLEDSAPSVASTVRIAVDYERLVEDTLARIADQLDCTYNKATLRDAGFDGIITSDDGRQRTLVQIKYSTRVLPRAWLNGMLTDAMRTQDMLQKHLLILSQPPSRDAEQWVAERPWIEVAVFSPGSDPDHLKAVVARLLAAPQRTAAS